MKFVKQMPRRCSTIYTIRRHGLLLLLGLLAILAPVSTEVAHADPGYAYYWSLTFDFENNFDGILHVDVGFNENGGVQQPALYGENFNVPCKRVGNVTLTGGSAKFAGGYLQCDLDVKSALTAAFAKCQQEHPGCTLAINEVESYRNFRMLAGVISTVVGSAPLFYHEDAVFTIMPDTATTQVASTLTPIGPLTSSPTAAPLNTPQFYAAEYECDGGVGCANYFTVTGALQSTTLPAQTPGGATTLPARPSTNNLGSRPSTSGYSSRSRMPSSQPRMSSSPRASVPRMSRGGGGRRR